MKECRTGTLRRAAVVFLSLVAFAACVLVVPSVAQAATKLPAPAWPHVKHSGWHGLKLSWKAVEGADGYVVYRWSKAKRKYVRRAWAKKASWRDTGLKADGKHTYKVAAYRKTAGGKKRVGKKSYKVAAVTYSKGAKVVNPGRPKAKRRSVEAILGEWDYVSANLQKSSYGKKVGGRKSRPFSDELRVVSSAGSIVSCVGDEWRAVGAGSCRLWLVAANGARSKPVRMSVVHNPKPARFSDPGLYDPEIVEFLNANNSELYGLTERLYAGWGERADWTVSCPRGGVPEGFPKWMGAADRRSLSALFERGSIDSSVALASVSFRTSGDGVVGKAHYVLSFYSAVKESVTPWNPYYAVVGPAYPGKGKLADGWDIGPDAGVDY